MFTKIFGVRYQYATQNLFMQLKFIFDKVTINFFLFLKIVVDRTQMDPFWKSPNSAELKFGRTPNMPSSLEKPESEFEIRPNPEYAT